MPFEWKQVEVFPSASCIRTENKFYVRFGFLFSVSSCIQVNFKAICLVQMKSLRLIHLMLYFSFYRRRKTQTPGWKAAHVYAPDVYEREKKFSVSWISREIFLIRMSSTSRLFAKWQVKSKKKMANRRWKIGKTFKISGANWRRSHLSQL